MHRHPCSNIFKGRGPASEPETKAVTAEILRLNELSNSASLFDVADNSFLSETHDSTTDSSIDFTTSVSWSHY